MKNMTYLVVIYQYRLIIGNYTNIEVIVVSLTTWEAHHSPKYQLLFYHDETKSMMNKQILSI